MSTLAAWTNDLRYACRAFARSPGFTLVALISLAIGIGANSAIFSVVSALLLRPLPYANADRQVILWNTSPGLGITEDWFSTAQYVDITQNVRSFESVAIAIGANLNLTGDGEPERIGTIRVSSNLLPMLGVRPVLGDLFTPADDRQGRTGKALLGFATWTRRYGQDPRVIGRVLTLNGQPFEIVGVLPASFALPREVMPTLGVVEDADIVVPLPLAANAAEVRNREDYNILATLAPGATLDQARAELDTLTARLRREHPDFYPPNGGLTFRALPLKEQAVGRARRALVVLMAAVGFVLLIACANVAHLQLSRALARRKELAVRAALGATRGRIARQLLTESVLLAIGGGALGLVFAFVCLRGIRWLGTASVPRLAEIALDGKVLLFTLGVSLLSGVFFGLVPALRSSRLDVEGHLKDIGRGASGAGTVWGRGQRLRRVLVIAELALSVMLLVGAGLLVRSFMRLQSVSPGFDAASALTLELTMTGRKYAEPEAVLNSYRALWDRLGRLPGVHAVGGVTALPLSNMMAWGPITVEGRATPEGEKFINADIRVVGGKYFEAMGIPLVKGRSFDDRDTRESARVVLVDEHMAAQLWPGQDPIGRRIRTGGFDVTPDTPWMTVIGVVGRVKQDSLDGEPRMAYYRYHGQTASRALTVVVRSPAADPASLAAAVRQQIREFDADMPVYKLQPMVARVSESLAERRFAMLLLTVFAVFALVLAAVGVYGVLAYLVAQGTRELGIRLALGATPATLARLVVWQGMSIALTGVALGLAGALVVTRFMRALLFGVAPTDPVTFVAIASTLTMVALAASYLPARRAAGVDPIVSLRAE